MGASHRSHYDRPDRGSGQPYGADRGFRLPLPFGAPARGTIAINLTSVLVIDDDPTFRELAVRLLAGMGLDVVGEADTVEAATVAARSLRPEAALVDVVLPDGSGVTLAGELAALPWRPRIVLISNDPEAVTAAVAQSAGAAAFVAKHELPGSPLGPLLTGEPQPE
jgi:CheY-like chemotaxis protein